MYIEKFEDITKESIETAGGKGANLGEMTRAGIPVPGGAVLTVAAYQRFMEYNKIDLSGQPSAIRDVIQNGTMPEDVRTEVLEFYHAMGDGVRVAVRSSATAEDLEDASFAGQQETYLNVQGDDMLMDRIKACYASLWGERAVSYRKENGYDSLPVALAVVIQLMVESEVAGVLFTQNPANGNKSEMLINASYGLGESVVSGAVSPDELVCGRDGQLVRQIIGSKETKVVYGKQQTVTVPVKQEDRTRLSLTASQVKELVKKGAEIEAHYGTPMDIEWGFSGDKLYILQARAITAKAEAALDESLMPPIRPVNKKMKEMMLFMLEKEPMSYYPLDYDFAMVLGKQKAVIFAEGGIKIDNDCSIDENGFMSLPTGKFSLDKEIIRFPALFASMGKHSENVKQAKAVLKKMKPEIRRFAEKNYEKAEMPECLDTLTKLHRLIIELAYARFRYAVFPGFLMNRKMEKYLKKVDEHLTAYDLLSGLSYRTADMNRDLAALADKIGSENGIKEAVLAGKSYEEVTELFPHAKEQFEAFLKAHGYKSDFNCYCFVAKTWMEDKERFLKVLRPLLTADRNREISLAEGEVSHHKLLEKMTAGLKEKQRKKLLWEVECYRYYHAYREETQYLWETAFYACRKVLTRSAKLLDVTYGELLFLFWDELQKAMQRGCLTKEELDTVSRRKEVRPVVEEYWRRQQWEALKGDGSHLSGISGSAGEAMGEVCIVTTPAEFGKLKRGDILVCPYTDPEWTTLFTLASAVVSDTGGALSHAAIVAREYNIPAVLATGCATTKLKDGDKVIVNGSAGEVRRL